MSIEFNKVTWYSKLLALIIFILFPIIGFCLGMQYQKAVDAAYIGTQSYNMLK